MTPPTDDDSALTPQELRTLLHWSKSLYYELLAAGALDRFALVPRIGPRRFSRPLVLAWLAREPTSRALRSREPITRAG